MKKKPRFLAWVHCDCEFCAYRVGEKRGLYLGEIPNQPGHVIILGANGHIQICHGAIEISEEDT